MVNDLMRFIEEAVQEKGTLVTSSSERRVPAPRLQVFFFVVLGFFFFLFKFFFLGEQTD